MANTKQGMSETPRQHANNTDEKDNSNVPNMCSQEKSTSLDRIARHRAKLATIASAVSREETKEIDLLDCDDDDAPRRVRVLRGLIRREKEARSELEIERKEVERLRAEIDELKELHIAEKKEMTRMANDEIVKLKALHEKQIKGFQRDRKKMEDQAFEFYKAASEQISLLQREVQASKKSKRNSRRVVREIDTSLQPIEEEDSNSSPKKRRGLRGLKSFRRAPKESERVTARANEDTIKLLMAEGMTLKAALQEAESQKREITSEKKNQEAALKQQYEQIQGLQEELVNLRHSAKLMAKEAAKNQKKNKLDDCTSAELIAALEEAQKQIVQICKERDSLEQAFEVQTKNFIAQHGVSTGDPAAPQTPTVPRESDRGLRDDVGHQNATEDSQSVPAAVLTSDPVLQQILSAQKAASSAKEKVDAVTEATNTDKASRMAATEVPGTASASLRSQESMGRDESKSTICEAPSDEDEDDDNDEESEEEDGYDWESDIESIVESLVSVELEADENAQQEFMDQFSDSLGAPQRTFASLLSHRLPDLDVLLDDDSSLDDVPTSPNFHLFLPDDEEEDEVFTRSPVSSAENKPVMTRAHKSPRRETPTVGSLLGKLSRVDSTESLRDMYESYRDESSNSAPATATTRQEDSEESDTRDSQPTGTQRSLEEDIRDDPVVSSESISFPDPKAHSITTRVTADNDKSADRQDAIRQLTQDPEMWSRFQKKMSGQSSNMGVLVYMREFLRDNKKKRTLFEI